MQSIREKLRELIKPPEPVLIEAGAGGEKLVATARLIFWCVIGLAPLSAALAAGRETPLVIWIALYTVFLAIALSLLVVLILRRGIQIRYIGFITSAGDVTLLTLMLVVVAIMGRQTIAINSQVSWVIYLLAILVTSLRFDVRICLFAGLVAVIQYVGLVVWVSSYWNVPINVYSPSDFHSTSLVLQVSRVVLMLAAAALSIGMVYRSRELVYASVTDRLTGIGNRTYFEERFAAELARVIRSSSPLALAIFDLDHFKQFNDRWGHENGDQALKLVAGVMKMESRKEDIVARWGGEEFAFVLPDTDLTNAFQKMERIRTHLKSETLVFGNDTASLTVSCGIAQFPVDGTNATSLFEAADRRLLKAKRTGRDRTIIENSQS